MRVNDDKNGVVGGLSDGNQNPFLGGILGEGRAPQEEIRGTYSACRTRCNSSEPQGYLEEFDKEC